MNNQCINFRQRTKTKDKRKTVYFYCAEQRKEITFNDCRGCIYKEYKKCTRIVENCAFSMKKQQNFTKTVQKSMKIKQKSSKLAKLERNRFSIITDDMEHCILCGNKKDHIHEVFPGAFRQRSIKEHMVLPLCSSHHRQIHNDTELSLYWKRSCQKLFEKSRTRDEFIKIFGRSYL